MEKLVITGKAISGRVYLRSNRRGWVNDPQQKPLYRVLPESRVFAERAKQKVSRRFEGLVEDIQIELMDV